MVRETLGDVLNAEAEIIAHQTNCMGVMGAGVALQIKNKLLSADEFKKYETLCKMKDADELLGTVQYLNAENGKLIANVFGENIPTGTGLDTDYRALQEGLQSVHDYASDIGASVAIPGLMGCGLAGGDWNIVRKMIEDIFGDSEVSLEIVFFLEEDYNNWVK